MSMITVAANLACIEIYSDLTAFDKVYRIGETVCGRKLAGDVLYIINQGTVDMPGWEADFDASPIYHPELGNLHCGFDLNLPALVTQLLPDIPEGIQVIVGGHSKGAGEVSILGPRLKLAGVNVVQAALFASPNAGYQRLADWLRANIPGISFRNASSTLSLGDPVPLVPISPFVAPYQHTAIDVSPTGIDRFNIFKWHSAELYQRGAVAWDVKNDLRMAASTSNKSAKSPAIAP